MAATDVRLVKADGTTVLAEVSLSNGDGVPVVNLANSSVQGVKALGNDLSTERPVFLGLWGSTSIANPTPVTEGQLQALKGTADGRAVILPYCVPEDVIQTPPVVMANDIQAHELVAAISGFKLCLIGLVISTTGAMAHLILSTATLTLPRVPLINAPSVNFHVPVKTAVNEAIDYQLSVAVGANTAWVTPICYKTKL